MYALNDSPSVKDKATWQVAHNSTDKRAIPRIFKFCVIFGKRERERENWEDEMEMVKNAWNNSGWANGLYAWRIREKPLDYEEISDFAISGVLVFTWVSQWRICLVVLHRTFSHRELADKSCSMSRGFPSHSCSRACKAATPLFRFDNFIGVIGGHFSHLSS